MDSFDFHLPELQPNCAPVALSIDCYSNASSHLPTKPNDLDLYFREIKARNRTRKPELTGY